VKVEFLVIGNNMPSTRDRVLQYLPYLEREGIQFSLYGPMSLRNNMVLRKFRNLLLSLRALYSARNHDLVFVQKLCFAANRWLFLRLLFRLNPRVVFDFDDAIFFDGEKNRMLQQTQLAKLEFILQRSATIIAGNDYLAEFARKYNASVQIVPTPVNTEFYHPAANRPVHRPVTIGWIGTRPNLGYLLRLVPVMKQILSGTDAVFLIVADVEKKPADLDFSSRIEFRKWRAAAELDNLRSFDIGIMPLADDAFTRGKCGFKLLQYMAVGIPVVASPVGVNRQIVEAGINGFLAGNEKEWLDQLRTLCLDRDLRERMGKAGRKTVVEKYDTKSVFELFLRSLRQGAGRGAN
jgi:glycosyltransferase involved in cell wall biosynthesis